MAGCELDLIAMEKIYLEGCIYVNLLPRCLESTIWNSISRTLSSQGPPRLYPRRRFNAVPLSHALGLAGSHCIANPCGVSKV